MRRTATNYLCDAIRVREASALEGIDIAAEINDMAYDVSNQAASDEILRAAGGFTRLVQGEIDRRYPEPPDPMTNSLGIATNPQVYRRAYFVRMTEEIRSRAQRLTAKRSEAL